MNIKPLHSTQEPSASTCNSSDADAPGTHTQTDHEIELTPPSQQMLDLDDCTPDALLTQTSLKRHTIHSTALSLLTSPDPQAKQLYDKLITCSEQITLRGDKVIHLQRCKHRLCALCQHIDASKRIAEVKAALDYLDTPLFDDPTADDSTGRSTALKVTLNTGITRPFSELRQLIKALHAGWSDLTSRSAIKRHTIGYQRATEITRSSDKITSDLKANPHIHGTLLLSVESGETPEQVERYVSSAIKRLWPKIIKRHLHRQGLKADLISTKGQEITPLWARTNDDLYGWLRYTLKGLTPSLTEKIAEQEIDTPSELSEIWSSINQAISGMRLVSRGGELKEMIREHQATERARSCARADDTPDAEPTHIWSYPLSRWISTSNYDPRHHCDSSTPARAVFSELTAEDVFALIERAKERQRLAIAHNDHSEIVYYLATGNMLKHINNREDS